MLMSLTMRCLFMPPADSRGTTSDVAIPTPSFSISGLKPIAHLYGLRSRKHFNYTAASAARGGLSPILVADMVLARHASLRALRILGALGGLRFLPQSSQRMTSRRSQREACRYVHDSVLKNWAILRNLLYRDATNSAGGIFFKSARCFCRLVSSRLAAAS